MNWEAIGAIGEVFGAMALFLVLLQVRHARAEVRRSISHGRAEVARELMLNHVNNERLTHIYSKVATGLGAEPIPFVEALKVRSGITAEEAVSVLWNEAAWWQYRVQAIIYVNELTTAERIAFDGTLHSYKENPLRRLWYETTKPTLNPDAVRYIDNLLAQPG